MKNAVNSMIKEKVLVDSNILVYAYDKYSEKHAKASQFTEDNLLEGSLVLSIQNLAEFARIITEKLQNKASVEEARSIILRLSSSVEVIYYDEHVIAEALSISSANEIHFFDALLAATMEKEGITAIATENEKDFRKISWLKVINPVK